MVLRQIISNKFWYFRYGLDQKDKSEDLGITEKWYENGIPEGDLKLKVYVPSSWSMYNNRNKFYHFGTAWFESHFYINESWGIGDGSKVTLVFGGVNYKANVWLNGQFVGMHEGGYTKFWFEINKFVKFGSENLLVIQVDNRYMENRIPWFQSPDWMNYGGVHRMVYVKLTPTVTIEDFKLTTNITFDKPLGQGYENPKVSLRVRLWIHDWRSEFRRGFEGSMIVTVSRKTIQQSVELPVTIGKSGEDFVSGDIKLDSVMLWSPEVPYLYDITFQLFDSTRKELDREFWRYGFREFKIDKNQFYLNNKPIVLCGINRHEDHPDVGNSLSPRLIYNDLNIMKEANINCIRTSHYPPYEATMEFADEMGFLMIEEIPVWGLRIPQFTTPYLVSAQKQLWEMIHRDKNHTSVIAWCVGNECATDTPEGREFIKSLIESAKELDPTRAVTYVTNRPMVDQTLDLVDFISINVYTGWYNKYDVSPKEVDLVFDNIWDRIENDETVGGIKPLIISEFGAEAIPGYTAFSKTHWSENYQYDFLRTYLNIMMEKEYIAGGCIWCFQDFRVSPYGEFLNRPKEYNNKGIVNMHRNPKISYYIVQSSYKKWQDKIQKTE